MYQNFERTIQGIVQGTAEATLLNNNANKASERIPVQRDMVAGEVAKAMAKSMLPADVWNAHEKGELHYHDLDYAPLFGMFNCMLISLDTMLKNGFSMGNAQIETPKSIQTACAVTAQIIAQVASHIYGGNTINNIDITLAPYVRKSYEKHLATGKLWTKDPERSVAYATEMTEKECHDAFQALEYEINTLHTANGQTPFTTLGFGLGTSWEARMIQRSILNVRREGLGKYKRTAVFPKLVFAIRDGVNRKSSDVNYDIKQLALKCSSERMYPDVLNYEKNVEVTGDFKFPMGCRSFLSSWKDSETDEFVTDGRCNLGVVSLNLPRIAIEASRLKHGMTLEERKTRFFDILEARLGTAYRALQSRVDRLRTVQAKVAPVLYMNGALGIDLAADELVFEKAFANGRATISLGYIGLNETANALYQGAHVWDSPEKQEFLVAVVARLQEATQRWKEESGMAYSLYSTPSESLCDRFCRMDVLEFGNIEGVTDKGYYTNSFHLDVFKKVSPDKKIDFESPYAKHATGGHITYTELPDMKRFLNALEYVWDYSADKVPYLGTNTPVDYCGECDFQGESKATENGFTCPVCGNHDPETLQVTRRVCGYLGAPNARPFIEGKQREVMGRVKHYGD